MSGIVQLTAVIDQLMEGQNFTEISFRCKSARATSYWGRKNSDFICEF